MLEVPAAFALHDVRAPGLKRNRDDVLSASLGSSHTGVDGPKTHLAPASKRDADDRIEGLVVSVPPDRAPGRVFGHQSLDHPRNGKIEPLGDLALDGTQKDRKRRAFHKLLFLKVIAPAEVHDAPLSGVFLGQRMLERKIFKVANELALFGLGKELRAIHEAVRERRPDIKESSLVFSSRHGELL